jgi:hypothetical protein
VINGADVRVAVLIGVLGGTLGTVAVVGIIYVFRLSRRRFLAAWRKYRRARITAHTNAMVRSAQPTPDLRDSQADPAARSIATPTTALPATISRGMSSSIAPLRARSVRAAVTPVPSWPGEASAHGRLSHDTAAVSSSRTGSFMGAKPTCARCRHQGSPFARFCVVCGTPFDERAG